MQLRAAIDVGESLVIESTLSGLCLLRVAQRVANGGHDVPEADVRRRFGRSIRQFVARYRELADDWVLIFNGESGHTTVANGSGADVDTIHDDNLWARFRSLADQGINDDETDSD